MDFKLTANNYFSDEANRNYMSSTQYGDWVKCAAMAFEKYVLNRWREDDTDYYIGGRYAHTYLLQPEHLDHFNAENPSVMSSKTLTLDELKDLAAKNCVDLEGYKSSKAKVIECLEENGVKIVQPPPEFSAKFKWLDCTLERFTGSERFMSMVSRGDKEVIISFHLNGVPWKSRIDNLRRDDKQFDDLKFMRSFESIYMQHLSRRVRWDEAYQYNVQMAIYREATRQECGVAFRPNILAATKQSPARLEWLQFKIIKSLDRDLALVAENMPQIQLWKQGHETPPRCEQYECDYCGGSKVIDRPNIPTPEIYV